MSLKTSRSDTSALLPHLLSPWEDHPDFGLVHTSGCPVCRSYIEHVTEASFSNTQPSFQHALEVRNYRRDDDFFDGIAEGRRRQKLDDKEKWEDLEKYRRDSDLFKEESEAIRAELDIAKGAVEQWRRECERLRGRPITALDIDNDSSDHDGENSFSPNATCTPRLSRSANNSTQTLTLSKPIASYASVASSQLPSPPMSAPLSRPMPSSPTSPPSTPLGTLSNTVANSSTSIAPTSVTVPKHIRDIQALCAAAHRSGNRAALTRVKALCTAAHATPKERKTDAQRWLLSNWRTPAWERTAPTPSTSPPITTQNASGLSIHPPRLDSPIETWVTYLSIHPTSWPRGVRKDAHGQPVYADVKASRIVARLKPSMSGNSAGGNNAGTGTNPVSRTDSSPNARNTFTMLAVSLFSDPTLYPSLLKQHGITVAPEVQYQRYECGDDGEVNLMEVVRHFAACGISEDIGKEMGGWAREYLRTGGGAGANG